MNIQLGAFVFRLSIIPVVVILCLLYLLISLGMWQLDRSDEKKALLDQQSQRSKDKIVQLTLHSAGRAEELRYREVKASGKYDRDHQFLIDNQVVEGKAGYFVMTPFLLSDSSWAVLVNRGWVPVNQDRSILPEVFFDVDDTSITGRINNFPSVGYKLKGAEIPTDGWPSVVQVIDKALLEKRLGYPLFPFQVQLGKDQKNGYWREWRSRVTMTPEKHKAYAFQWFGLAITLVILIIWFNSKKKLNE